ncbi:uncharacterized protein MELLADRAFT_71569 [Melampsora larici-populina 98AG31]|uniref:Uncharacterized protein n=1 Tax=Melampsora larici-populina (strain 98AG31 / pathotype 3-4-7) TaxID=747676 RepID=F4RHZ3_MELLP|nr:uncharacterized protein MELLADRAFT_71569 [Melampsora larici-populina 98AG31]EGG07908.1 hypothetical protein MELLADRAFT_71569 [Melampsora larici-populina 98AG31]
MDQKIIRNPMNTFTPYGRLRFIYDYFLQDQVSKKDSSLILKGLLQDFLKRPIRTIFLEGFAILKMTIGLSFLITSGFLFRFLPNDFKANETLSIRRRSDSKVKKDQMMSSVGIVKEDEQTELLQSNPLDEEERKDDDIDGFNDQETFKLRFKTAFTSSIGFGLIIKKALIQETLHQKKNNKDDEIFKCVRDLIKFKVDEEVVESSLEFERIKTDEESDDKLVYLVHLNLEQFAQTHLVEVGESDWLIEIEVVNSFTL